MSTHSLRKQINLLKLPYDQRRIIVVTDKVPAGAATRRYGWREILGMFSPTFGAALTSMPVEAIIEALTKMRQGGEGLVPVSWTDASWLQFPGGIPAKMSYTSVTLSIHPPTFRSPTSIGSCSSTKSPKPRD